MQMKDLVTPIDQMTDDELLEHVRAMRHRREVIRPAARRIVEKAVKRESTARTKKVDKAIAGMSEEERLKLIQLLGG